MSKTALLLLLILMGCTHSQCEEQADNQTKSELYVDDVEIPFDCCNG